MRQLELCKAELIKQVAFARDCITEFEKAHPEGVGSKRLSEKDLKLRASPRSNFEEWKSKEVGDCGDEDANDLMRPLVQAGLAMEKKKVKLSEKEKTFKDKMAWTRDQVHLLRRLQKEVTGRVRSLRFFENVRRLQREGVSSLDEDAAAASSSAAPKKQKREGSATHALLSCCGHVGECEVVQRAASEQLCHFHPQCKAPARPSCVIPVSELGAELSGGGGSTGVKLASLIGLVKRLPRDERVLVFVQFQDLLDKVAEALKESGVPTNRLTGTPNQRSTIIEAFQQPVLKANEPRVLILNLRDESAAGANLTAAAHAIFVHPLLVNSQQEYTSCDTQAVGRIRRYGQSRTVQLYRFICPNTIDADIFSLRRGSEADELMQSAANAEQVAPLQ